MNQPLILSDIFWSTFISLRPHRIEVLGSCSGLGFDLRECCVWFGLLSRQLKLSHASNKAVLLFYFVTHMFAGGVLFNFLQQLFICVYCWLTVRQKRDLLLAYLGFQYTVCIKLNHG